MERKINNKLLAWKNDSNRMPLLVYGARQVGKTHTLREFADKYYKNVACGEQAKESAYRN